MFYIYLTVTYSIIFSLTLSILYSNFEIGVLINIIGRAKQAPHWAVQSRFNVIYICM